MRIIGCAEVNTVFNAVYAAKGVDASGHLRHGLAVHHQTLEAALERLVEALKETTKVSIIELSKFV